MAGHSRPKDGVASARLCPGHPRSSCCQIERAWMPGTSSAKTRFALLPGHDDRDVVLELVDPFFGQTAEQRACPISLHRPACKNLPAIPNNFSIIFAVT